MYAAYGVRGNPMTIQKYLELFRVLGIFIYKAQGGERKSKIFYQ